MTGKNEKKVRIAVTSQGSEADQNELEAIRQEAAEYKDKYLRAAAEVENTRKRLERRYADQAEEEKKRLLRAFLAVADDLERALAYSDRPSSDFGEPSGRASGRGPSRAIPLASQGGSLRDGVQLTYQELQRLLDQEGVEPLEAIGQPFDPYYHEAVDTVAGDHDQETVVGERQKGYLYRGELLRPAKVEVAVPTSG